MSGGRWTFVGVESGTVEAVEASTWCVNVDALTRDELEVLEECEPTGFYGETALEILEARGVALERVLEMVDGLRSSTGLDVESLEAAVRCARGVALESRVLEWVRVAATNELRRALLVLECIEAGDFDSATAGEWVHALEVDGSGLHGALVEAADVLDIEARVRAEMLEEHYSIDAWASDSGYSRRGTALSWFDEYGDEVDIEAMFEAALESRVDYVLKRGRFAPRAAAVESGPFDDDQDYDNAHRCESCGVTGGGVEGGTCEACALSAAVESGPFDLEGGRS